MYYFIRYYNNTQDRGPPHTLNAYLYGAEVYNIRKNLPCFILYPVLGTTRKNDCVKGGVTAVTSSVVFRALQLQRDLIILQYNSLDRDYHKKKNNLVLFLSIFCD